MNYMNSAETGIAPLCGMRLRFVFQELNAIRATLSTRLKSRGYELRVPGSQDSIGKYRSKKMALNNLN